MAQIEPGIRTKRGDMTMIKTLYNIKTYIAYTDLGGDPQDIDMDWYGRYVDVAYIAQMSPEMAANGLMELQKVNMGTSNG